MRLQHFLSGVLVAFAISASATSAEDTTEPEISVVTSFPEENPFGHIVNGEKNKLLLHIENKSDRNVTLISIAGSLNHPETDALVKNLTSLTYGVPLMTGVKVELPYSFYSEFKPGDLRLNIWLDHIVADEKFRVVAYDSIVTIVEPAVSILDFKLISTYLMVSALFGGLAYLAYTTFVPQAKKPRTKKTTQPISAPTGTVTATGAGGYQEEWIPEHHLKKTKGKKSGFTSGTSGDELSGGEISGTEKKTRRSKK